MHKPKVRLSYANVVATLALVLAVGGASAFAASELAKNSVGTKQLKKDAVTGQKVKNGSLSGADIGGWVPHASEAALAGRARIADVADHAGNAQVADAATSAGYAQIAKLAEGALHAGNADSVGGLLPSAFQAAGSVQRVDWSKSGCAGSGSPGCKVTLLKTNGFVLEAACLKNVSGEVELFASGPAGTVDWLSGWIGGPSGTQVFEEFGIGTSPTLILGLGGASAQMFQGNLVLRSEEHTLSIPIVVTQDNNGACKVAGVASTA
jgi:hypothetical protein